MCPTLPSGEGGCPTVPRVLPSSPSSSQLPGISDTKQKSVVVGKPVDLSVRVMYFSRDGEQADNGQLLEISMNSAETLQALLQKAREDAGVGSKGKVLFKMRPLVDLDVSIEESGILREPQALHLMLSRKHRPPEVADRAAAAAAELSVAMAEAAAEGAARSPRQKKTREPSPGDVLDKDV